MSSPATECPDNSTECLLRAILDANSQYNWDPVTFAFTAAFTILTVLVAVAALFQTLIAAGPGRLKASERAIGPKQHNQRAVTRFSWREYRFRTIVNVPVIDVRAILQHEHPSTVSVFNMSRDEPTQQRLVPPKGDPSEYLVVAGWSQLLNDLSLSDISFRTIQCLTDYLPDDIPAALAWAKVETLVLLCIMKGCTQLAEEDGYIVCTGRSTQLSWNMHPTLGPIGVYRTWDVQDTPLHTLEEVQRMIPLFLGYLYLSGQLFFKAFAPRKNGISVWFDLDVMKQFAHDAWSRCRHDHDHCRTRKHSPWMNSLTTTKWDEWADNRTGVFAATIFADRPARPKAFPFQVLQLHSTIKTMYEEYFPWLILLNTIDTSVLEACIGSRASFVQFDASEAMYQDPTGDGVMLRSWVVGASQREATSLLDRPILTAPDPAKSFPGKKHSYNFNYKSSLSDSPLSDEITSSDIRISKDAVYYLSKWLSDERYFENASANDLVSAKRWFAYQLAELDWVLTSTGDDAICAASNLVALGCRKFAKVHFTKISRRFVLPETLDAFNLTWKVNPKDKGSVIVTGYLDSEAIQRLFTYTKAYIEKHREELHTVHCPESAQGFYFASKNSGDRTESPKTSRTGPQSIPFADAIVSSNDRSFQKAAEVVTEPVDQDNIFDEYNEPDRQRNSSIPMGEPSLRPAISEDNKNSGVDEKSAKPSSSSASGPTMIQTENLDSIEQKFSNRVSPEDQVSMHVDRHVAAVEALAFFRAGIYAAYLATGTDTSLVLTSDKRFQLVQVQ